METQHAPRPRLPRIHRCCPEAWPWRAALLTSHLKGFSPECCKECTLSDILRLNDFPQVSHVKGMSFVCAATQNALTLKISPLESSN